MTRLEIAARILGSLHDEPGVNDNDFKGLGTLPESVGSMLLDWVPVDGAYIKEGDIYLRIPSREQLLGNYLGEVIYKMVTTLDQRLCRRALELADALIKADKNGK